MSISWLVDTSYTTTASSTCKKGDIYFCLPPRPRMGAPRPRPPLLDPPLPSPGKLPLSSVKDINYKLMHITNKHLSISEKFVLTGSIIIQWNLFNPNAVQSEMLCKCYIYLTSISIWILSLTREPRTLIGHPKIMTKRELSVACCMGGGGGRSNGWDKYSKHFVCK